MSVVVALWLLLRVVLVQGPAVAAVSSLSPVGAVCHVVAARGAGQHHDVPIEALLAIAEHESRFEIDTRTPEVGHRVSCGVMTPEPKPDCAAQDLTLQGGYEAGAAHLHRWLDSTACRRDLTCALAGYAGGYFLVNRCRAFPTDKACAVVTYFKTRAAVFRRALGDR